MVESRNTTVREPPARPRDTQSPVGPSIISTTAVGAKSETVNVRGLFDLPEGGVVSSLALTPDGCYVFAGFGGGEIRLYAQALGTVGAASKAGTIVAQIRSKVCFVCPEDFDLRRGGKGVGYDNWPMSGLLPLLWQVKE